MALLGGIVLLSGCEKYLLDRQMAELCAKDGGVRVYETVTLARAEYEKMLKYRVTAKSQEQYYGPEYRYVVVEKLLAGKRDGARTWRGEFWRIHKTIYRKSDNHLLGESVDYIRVGGDLILLGTQPSGNGCPKPRVDLAQSILVKGN